MLDLQSVCCTCGDVGFPEKIFRCAKCRFRFQHSYCSNYYSDCSDVCNWCHYDDRNSTAASLRPASGFSSSSSSRKSAGYANNDVRSAYSGDKIKQKHREEGGGCSSEKAVAGKAPSPRPTTRRYKLLKDVLC